tara:strand:- start:639 stop:1253 length:615 start_codon:yes stop_codon:yes gene_type:complete
MKPTISVIVPIRNENEPWQELVSQLSDVYEVIVVSGSDIAGGRAACMNEGARRARGDYLWFLHADCQVNSSHIECLARSLHKYPDALHYFRLVFHDGPWMLVFNQWGAYVRSHWFNIPFGDQGFCLSRAQFNKLKGYRLGLSYGEDHVFVWQARKAKVKLMPMRKGLGTSGRTYEERGWLKNSLIYQWLWLRQCFWCVRKILLV